MDLDTLTNIIAQAGVEWDLECREAFQQELFPWTRDQWVARAVLVHQQKVTRQDLDNTIGELDLFAESVDEYETGLPTYNASYMEEMRRILCRGLNLGEIE